jgi:outer membrane biosynthesis protein TonB
VALSDEQNAMLRLLSQGEQGYGDIAALLGLSEAEVRAKVVGALAQLEAEGKPAPDVPPPVPGGAKPAAEAAPPEPEPVEEEPDDEAEDDEPAVAEAVAPSEPAEPKAPKKAKPKPKGPKATPKPKPAPAAASGDRPGATGKTITLPTGRGAWLLGGGVLAAIAVIVVVVLLVSGGDDNSSTTAGSTPPAAETGTGTGANTGAGGEEGAAGGEKEATGEAKEPTVAELTAVDGSEAKGQAIFGRYKNKLALQIEATGLEPTTKGTDSYTIWLAQSANKMLPLAFPVEVSGTGKAANAIAAQFEVPVEVLAYLANGTFDQIAITRTDDKLFTASVKAAKKAETTPKYLGDEVLRGTIVGPIIGIAKQEAAEKEEGEAAE